jgi:hypothetical protein
MVTSISIGIGIGLLAIYLGTLWLLLVRATARPTDYTAPSTVGLISETREHTLVAVDQDSFMPMPDHLTTHAEMVAWMTEELPRLTEGMAARPQGR